MSIITVSDLSVFLRNVRGKLQDKDLNAAMGVRFGQSRQGGWVVKELVHQPDFNTPDMPMRQAYIRIDNYQIAKEMQLQLMRLGCPQDVVALDPKGSKLRHIVSPDLAPGSPLSTTLITTADAIVSLLKAAPFSSRLESIVAEASSSKLNNDPKAEAFMRHLRGARKEAEKLRL